MAMDRTEIQAIIASERQTAMGAATNSRLAEERIQAIDYYEGNMADMPRPEGRSGAISTDVFEAVEGLMPQLMDIFAGSDEVVQFDPVGPEDEAAAQQETDYVNHVFWQKNPGFMTLYSMIKDALLSKLGVVKIWWEESESEKTETYSGLSEDEYAILRQTVEATEGAEIVELEEETESEQGEPQTPGELPQPPQTTYSCVVKYVEKHGEAKVAAIPPEEFLISKAARTIRDASYVAHRGFKRRSELVDLGFDPEQVKGLSTREQTLNSEEVARNTVEDFNSRATSLNPAQDMVEIVENYIMLDYEGDGKQRLYQVWTAGLDGQLLRWDDGEDAIEAADCIPFAGMTPIPITHRLFGRSIADVVAEIQRIKTALIRALLDNIYLSNNQRVEVSESHANERTIDDLLDNRPGGVVRTKAPGGINVLTSANIGSFAFPMVEYIDNVREWRTGVTKNGQGIDANALQNTSATAASQMYSAAQAKVKLIARIFAETGIKDLFWLLHGTIRKHSNKQDVVRLRNAWTPVDPRNWSQRNDLTIDVGLGSGSKQEQVSHLMAILGMQKEAIAAGMPFVKPQHIFETTKRILNLMGFRNAEAFMDDPSKQPPQQPGNQAPDPKMVEVQGKMQLEQQKAQADMQLAQQKAGIDAETAKHKAAMDAQASIEAAQIQMQIKREELALKERLAIRQQDLEAQLRREQIAADAQMGLRQQMVQPGGDI